MINEALLPELINDENEEPDVEDNLLGLVVPLELEERHVRVKHEEPAITEPEH